MKSINKNAPVKCSNTITINASSKKVWDVLTNINNWDNWQTDISTPKLNGELKAKLNIRLESRRRKNTFHVAYN